MTTRRTIVWVTVLYLAQGFPYGVVSKIWPVYFRVHGVSLTAIGLMSLLSLPWSWKPLWAPLVDRFGSRRSWIAPALGILALLCAAMPWLPSDGVSPLVVAALLVFTLASATQDIAIDAWAVDVSTPKTVGFINGIRASAFRVAVILAGGVSLLFADRLGWTAVWIGCSAVFVALAVSSLAMPSGDGRAAGRQWQWRQLVAWLWRRDMIPVVAFALTFKIGSQTLSRMVEPFWIDRGMTLSEIGLVSNTIGLAVTIGGALTGGWFVTRFGLLRALLWLGLSQGIANLGYAAVAGLTLPREAIYGASVLESFGQGLGTAALLSFLTECCDRENAATQYALLSALFALSRELAGAASGWAAERMGYAAFFLLTAALELPPLALLPLLRDRVRAFERRAADSSQA